jgi:hypothetical protein
MDMVSGIIEAANALGINPADLATIISYETGGTFDPRQPGPTTKWGRHRGLIQFGEPQARRYNINWDDALNSQLGANGAVVNYFRDNGARPGMKLMDLYSIVNAGGPGRYGAVDSGTSVEQKVHSRNMQQHAAKASALLGGKFTPSQDLMDLSTGGTGDIAPTAAIDDTSPLLPDNNDRMKPVDLLTDEDIAASYGGSGRGGPDDPYLTNEGGEAPSLADAFGRVAPEPEFDPRMASAVFSNPAQVDLRSGLADVFKIKPIGGASGVDPNTGQPIRARRNYG